MLLITVLSRQLHFRMFRVSDVMLKNQVENLLDNG